MQQATSKTRATPRKKADPEETARRKVVAERLRTLREKLQLSQEEVADKVNISRNSYTQYETATNGMYVGTLQKLARFFEVPADYLLGEITYEQAEDDRYIRGYKGADARKQKQAQAFWEIIDAKQDAEDNKGTIGRRVE